VRVFAFAFLAVSMHSTTRETDPVASTVRPRADHATDGDLRVVYNAVRTLVSEVATLSLDDLLAVTRLEPETAAAAMDRLGREGPLSVHRLDVENRAWLVRRTDR
jgi:hypothetical protein